MKHLYAVAAAVMFASCLEQGWSQSGSSCLSYEPAVVKLTGILISRTYPGPPEYESIRKGDEPETYWLLALRRPACVNQADPKDGINDTKVGIRQIQIVFHDDKDYRAYRSLLGRRVIATGTLYGAHTAHHKTPVLLWLTSLAKAK